jgi:hypothetical protein
MRFKSVVLSSAESCTFLRFFITLRCLVFGTTIIISHVSCVVCGHLFHPAGIRKQIQVVIVIVHHAGCISDYFTTLYQLDMCM